MGFYDNYNFDGLKLFARITDGNAEMAVTEPAGRVLSIIKQLKTITPPHSITVAEVGIGYGATALQILKILDENDTYYAFDFEDSVKALEDDLKTRDFGIKCQVVTKGNSREEWDSYNWNLSDMVFEMRERHETGIFDAVYLDGAHTLIHDGLAVCLLKELIKAGGYLILDDLFWTYAGSSWGRNVGPGRLTEEQMKAKQVLRVQELFLTNDPNFERLSSQKDGRGIFRKRQS